MILDRVLRFDTPTARLRAVAFLEGVSYLVLLFVAMPLKYLADQPMAVRVVGSLHGALFIALAYTTWRAISTRGKTYGWGFRIGIASVIPFGTFALDRGLAGDDDAYRASARSGATPARGSSATDAP
jgi:integral membrane protein